MKNSFTFFALILVVAVLVISYKLTANSSALSPGEFNRQINITNVQLIDIRTVEEYEAGHIHNAVNISFKHKFFIENFAPFNRRLPLYIYCKSGMRTEEAAPMLENAGFSKVYYLSGGINAWKEAGLKLYSKEEDANALLQ